LGLSPQFCNHTAGAGVTLTYSQTRSFNTITNNGSVTGGTCGGLKGAAGMSLYQVLGSTGTVINNGSISGGTGGISHVTGRTGGVGVSINGVLTNTSTGNITGGTGGTGGASGTGGAGGAGGWGVSLGNGVTLNNGGHISGGNGGTGSTHGGAGGTGAYVSQCNKTSYPLINNGTIAGGTGGQADAVKFGGLSSSTLVVEPCAVFNGKVVASTSVNDVLQLAGTQAAGTPITLGTEFTNFSTLDFASGASWTVDATKGDLTAPHMDELPFIVEIAELMPRLLDSPLGYPEALAELWMADHREDLDNLRDHYLRKVAQLGVVPDGARRFTDKMPLNETHLGLIGLLFPEPPLLHVVRHPWDVVLSVYSNLLTHGFYCAYALESAALHYARAMELVDHYRKEMSLKFLCIRYEDIVEDQQTSVRRVLDFVGEEFHPACLAFHENRRYARTASYAQVSEGLYDRSRYRYRIYLPQLQRIVPIVRPVIDSLGYTI